MIPAELMRRLIAAILGMLFPSAALAATRADGFFDTSVFAESAVEFATKRAGELIGDLQSADATKVQAAVAEAIAEGRPEVIRERLAALYPPERLSVIARTEFGLAQNGGAVLQWDGEGYELFEVHDSPGCLPSSHAKGGAPSASGKPGVVEEDREANGQVWTKEQVLAHLLGHPHCERGFSPVIESRRAA